jgi:hypothetical protein
MIESWGRKAGGPIAYVCPDCGDIVDASEWAVEWELLSGQDKTIRLVVTALLSIGVGFGLALLMATVGWLLGYHLGIAKAQSLPASSASFLGFVIVVGLIITGANFYRLISRDVPGSRIRLQDPKYRKLLVRLGFMEN